LTRHELKEQIQHDRFTDSVSNVVTYATSHRETLIRWAIVVGVVLVLAGAGFWYSSYRDAARQKDLEAAFEVLDAPVGPANPDNPSGRTFATQDAKTSASIKALSEVVAKDGGSRQGLTAQYYLGTLKAQKGDAGGAEADLKAVAQSSNECAPLAKIALAQLYAGENKLSQAQGLLRELVNKPTDLVSKAQAQILLARMEETTNPQEAKKILQSLKGPTQDPAVSRAVDQISAQLTK
jgi:Tetratricopeptide repeat-like domain